MAELITFEIESNKKAVREMIPIYVLGEHKPVQMMSGRSANIDYVSVRFSDGTIIEKHNDIFMVDDYTFLSLDEAFEVLSENVVETILFNIDIFRSL